MALDPSNPWAIHLYIHLMEAGDEAGDAVAPAQKLEYLVPGAPHMQARQPMLFETCCLYTAYWSIISVKRRPLIVAVVVVFVFVFSLSSV